MNLSGRELNLGLQGADVHLLHTELAGVGLPAPDAEVLEQSFGEGTQKAVQAFQKQHELETTGVVDERTAAVINQVYDSLHPDDSGEQPWVVTGLVAAHARGTVAGLTVRVLDRSMRQDDVLGMGDTDAQGSYTVTYLLSSVRARGKDRPDLVAQVMGPNGQPLAGSDIWFDAGPDERIDILLPDDLVGGLNSEHEAVAAAVAAHFDGALTDLREDSEHQDLTYLSRKTGWDARAVALASTSAGLAAGAAQNDAGVLTADHYYALLRAGVGGTPDAVHALHPQIVAQVWDAAVTAGIVPASVGENREEALAGFTRMTAATSLDASPLPGASTLRELLTQSVGDDPTSHQQFAELMVQHRDDPAGLWPAVQNAFGVEQAARLQLDGRLALLTMDNAPLVAALHQHTDGSLASPADLATAGFGQAESWLPLIDPATVPDAVPGDDDDTKRQRYADVLAAQVRVSFPTAVTATQIGAGTLALHDQANTQAVQGFLTEHAADFQIGAEPVGRYLSRTGTQVGVAVRDEVVRLQRVYQLTRDDAAMGALLVNGLDSAYAVVQAGPRQLRSLLGQVVPNASIDAISAKALQVHLATLNVASTFLTTRAAPSIGGGAGALVIDPSMALTGPAPVAHPAHGVPVAEPPDLEQLFGSMDLCTCTECRSVLSPAAYLVDLLEFAARPVSSGSVPQDVLLGRRPDLQHLPLSCENTNTPLPYIDVVNETLEYFVTSGLSLAGYTGHDTDERDKPEDLLASPKFVQEAAYTVLAGEFFPPPLPFHRPLALLRRHMLALRSPGAPSTALADVLVALRADDAIERASATDYGWRDVAMERVGLSRAEHTLLTDRTITLADQYGFPAGTTDSQAVIELSNPKAFARRVGLSYDDVVQLLQTRFVNPDAALLPTLRHFGLDVEMLSRVHAGTIDDTELADRLPAGVSTDEVRAFVADSYDRVTGLIVLQQLDDAGPCDFAGFRLQRNDPDAPSNALAPLDFVRVARVVRLWRTLGWTLAGTDAAMAALFPPEDLPTGADPATDAEHLDDGFATVLLRLGVLLDVMNRLQVAAKDLPSLLTLWGPMGCGAGSLYEQVFLAPTVLTIDQAFAPDDAGQVLVDASQHLIDHRDALRAAIGLTGGELDLIIAALFDGATTTLDLAGVSAVYARAWLARRLRLSVAELLALTRHTGLDPFAKPEPPSPGITGLLDLLDSFKSLRLKVVQALYLMFDDDLTGVSAPLADDVASLARTLRASFADIDAQFTVVDDPTGQIAQSRMSLVYGPDAAQLFFALIGGTFTVSVPFSNDTQTLDPAVVAASGDRLSYDDLAKSLSFAGLLISDLRTAIAGVAGVSADLLTAADDLATAGQTQTAGFFDRYPELAGPYQTFVTSTAPPHQRRQSVLDAVLPELVRRRREQLALAALSSVLRVDPDVVSAIADDVTVLHADGDPNDSALADLTVVGQAPSRAVDGPWTGAVEAPASGHFGFAVDTDASAVRLYLNDAQLLLDQVGQRWRSHNPITLVGGALVPVRLEADGPVSRLSLLWQTTGQGWLEVPTRSLYPQDALDHLSGTRVRVGKVASLAVAASVTPGELTRLAADPDLLVDGAPWPNALRVGDSAVSAADRPLTVTLRTLADYATAKARWSPSDDRLLAVLQDPTAIAPQAGPLSQLTGWTDEVVDVLLTRLGRTRADLAHLAVLSRLTQAADVVTALGTTAAAALATATNDPSAEQVAAFQSAVRARFAADDWRDVVKPINDDLRSLQRNALVAYVLRRLSENPDTASLDTPDKLFEYFLMDVQMEPCTQTSRIRHALSSVQLFLERCLMNLEPEVSPSSVGSNQWAWMKRYRVWEAARKVFLWPENWLEPELRDDQSPIFKQVMGELLQGDITADRAAAALTSYLNQLAEIAHLQPCGIYVDEQDAGTADDVVHVVARTHGAHRKYFYRRREYGFWTPWEQVKLDIEDNPIVPVVWKGRLFVFWLRLVKATPTDQASQSTSGPAGNLASLNLGTIKSSTVSGLGTAAQVHVKAILSYSEYVDGAWTPVRTSEPNLPTELGSFTASGAGAFDRLSLRLSTSGETGALQVSASGAGWSYFQLYSSSAEPIRAEDTGSIQIIWGWPASRSLSVAGNALTATYQKASWAWDWHKGNSDPPLQRTIITGPTPMRVAAPAQTTSVPWDMPFLLSDGQHAFYVETTEEVVSVLEFEGYGLGGLSSSAQVAPSIPPIYWQEEPQFTPPGDPWEHVVNPVEQVSDPASLRLGLSEDVHITKAVGSLGSVTFNGTAIGPAGALGSAQLAQSPRP